MDIVQVRDLRFKVSIPEATLKARIAELGAQISKDLNGERPLFLCVLTGAFMFGADLLREITTDCEIAFIRVASYAGTASTGDVKQIMGLTENVEGRSVVIVEDIIDSGLTMKELLALVQAKGPKDLRVAALLVKPEKLQVDFEHRLLRLRNPQ